MLIQIIIQCISKVELNIILIFICNNLTLMNINNFKLHTIYKKKWDQNSFKFLHMSIELALLLNR